MKSRSVVPMRVAKIGYIVMSVVFCAVGILFIALPRVFAPVIGRALGVAMIVFGVVKLVGYFSKDLFRLAFQYDLEFGVLLAALGIIVLLKPADAMDFIFTAMGVAILTDALFKFQISIDSRKFGIRCWWLILTVAAITGMIGLIIIFWSGNGADALTVLLGASLFAEGILNLCVAIGTVKIVKNQQPDRIEID